MHQRSLHSCVSVQRRHSPELICLDAREKDGRVRSGQCIRHEFAFDFECCYRSDVQESVSKRFTLVEAPIIESAQTENKLDVYVSPRTIPLSSPGRAASFSPTWTMPLSIRPDTASPDAVADWPLKTFETGIRNGASSARAGTSSESIGNRCQTVRTAKQTSADALCGEPELWARGGGGTYRAAEPRSAHRTRPAGSRSCA